MNRLLLILLMCPALFYAKGIETDTLKTRYADSLLTLANEVFYSNPDSSIYFANNALDYSLKNNLDVQTAMAWFALAKPEVLRGNIEQALKLLKNAIALLSKHNEQKNIARCYGLMSTAVSKIHHNDERIDLLLKAIGIYRELKDEQGLRGTLMNLANAYSKGGEYDKALEAVNESEKYTEPGSSQLYYYHINAGIIYLNKKKFTISKEHFDSCLTISRRFKMIDAEVTALTQLGVLSRRTEDFSKAEYYLNEAINMARINHLPLEESDALTELVKGFEQTGDYKKAYFVQNRLNSISDSLFNIEKLKNINSIEARLKVSEKEKTIALQKLDMEQQVAEQEKSSQRIVLLIIGAGFLALVLFFTIFFYLKVKRQKREVEIQKNRAEKLNSLNQKIFAVIAHDFKSPMITLNMLMDLMDQENISREDLSAYSADVRNQVIQSGQILDNLLNWAKTELNMSHGLNLKSSPYAISEEIIKELNYMSARKNVSIVNTIPESLLLKAPPDILRIITRNLLSNAVKFSYSNSVVTIGISNHNTISVEDSGSGINEKTINELFTGTAQSKLGTFNETGFGLGLYITHELINKFNGKISAENNSPSGTIFKFVLPAYE